jgi:kinesin family protein 18/19
VIDHRQLDFDRPDPKAAVKRGMPGAKAHKDRKYVKSAEKWNWTDVRYIFDEVLNQEATQSMVFERTAKPLLAGVLDGYNATVFAYGVGYISHATRTLS